jgi:phosphoserine phosphatase
MRAAGAYCVLVSGGFTYFASRIADTCGFHENYSNQLEINNGRLTGRIIEPILGKEAKLSILKRLIKDHALEPVDTVVVGDGANDLPMIKAAGLGVSFHGKASVAVAAPTRIEHGDLTTLLFYQGFYEQEFSTGTNTKL